MAEANKENADFAEDNEFLGMKDCFVNARKNRRGKGARYAETKNAANKRQKKKENTPQMEMADKTKWTEEYEEAFIKAVHEVMVTDGNKKSIDSGIKKDMWTKIL